MAWAIVFALRRAVVLRNQHSGLRAKYLQDFFGLAERLTSDPRLDDARLDMMRKFVSMVTDAEAFEALSRMIAAIEQSIDVSGLPATVPHLHDDLQDDWPELLFTWTMAVSYQRPIGGLLLRARIARLLDPKMLRKTGASIESYVPRAFQAA